MKIINVQVFVCLFGCNFVILKIEIDVGIMGIGDVIVNGCELLVVLYLIDYLCLVLIGCDVSVIEEMW